MFNEPGQIKEQNEESEKKHKDFVENRKKSIKNEFALVKELLKKNIIVEEEDENPNEELKKNTDQNIQVGRDALNEEDSESSSESKSESDKEEKSEKNDNKIEEVKKILEDKGFSITIKEKYLNNQEFSTTITQFDNLINTSLTTNLLLKAKTTAKN